MGVKKLLKPSNEIDSINYDPYPDCDPSCWEIDDEYVDWDELDRIMFGDD